MNTKSKTWVRLALVLTLALVAMLGTTTTARAVEFIDGNNIPADQTIDDDVFIAGDNVIIDGTVNGDLFVSAATVTINGVVKGSLVTGAQTIFMNGTVDGSMYAGSSSMELGENAVVGRNLFYGGFGLLTQPGSQIGRDLLVGAYQLQHSGEAGRDLMAGLGALELNGKIGGDVRLEIGIPGSNGSFGQYFAPPGVPSMIEPGLRIGDDAEIGGMLEYTSNVDQASAIQAQPAGGVVYQTPTPDQRIGPTQTVRWEVQIFDWFFGRLRELFTLLALGGLAVWLLPSRLSGWADRVRSQFVPSTGYGLLVVILGYAGAALVGMLVLALGIFFGVVTLGGLARTVFGVGFSSLSLAFTIFLLLVSYGSKLIVAFLAGKLILARLAPQYAGHRVWPMLLGVVVYVALRSIPILGWLLGVVVTLAGLGAIWLVFRDERAPALPAAAA
jgi:hypothetical protein